MGSTIRNKFILFGFFVTLLTSLVLSSLIYYNAFKLVKTSYDKISFFGIDSVEFSLDSFMNELEDTLNLLDSSGIFKLEPNEDEKTKMLQYMSNIQSSHSKILTIYFGTKNGKTYVPYSRIIPKDYDPRTRTWYKTAIDKGHMTWTDIYIDATTGNEIVTLVKPIYSSGKFIGVSAIDVELNTITDYLSKMKLGKTGYFILLDHNYKIMVHPNKNNLNKIVPVDTLRKALESQSSGTLFYTYENTLKRGTFKTLHKTGWKIAGTINVSEALGYSSDVLKNTLLLELGIIIISLLLSLHMTNRITRNLNTLVNDINKIEQGHLDVRSYINANDESGIIAAHLNKMVDKLNSILESTSDAIWEYDIEKDKFMVSAKYVEISGYDFTGEPKRINSILSLIHTSDRYKTFSNFSQLLRGEVALFQREFRMKKSDNSYSWIYARGKVIDSKEGKIIKVAGSMADITEKKHHEEEIYKLAFYDSVTNLPNIRLFVKELEKTIEKSINKDNKAAVILIDLDDFKKVNDILGHGFGDKLLQELSLRIKDFQCEDVFPSSLKGDEFLILLKNISSVADAVSFCQRFKKSINVPINIEGDHLIVTASAGISIFPDDGTDADSLISNANIALHSGKSSEKNKILIFYQSLYNKYNRILEIENSLKKADYNKEFNVYYQPQIKVKSKTVRGFEALMRWTSPIIGTVSPSDFIPVAEQLRLIISIGEWTIQKVFQDTMKLASKGIQFERVSINLSTLQLLEGTFLEFIDKAIKLTSIDTSLIEFEITESTLIADVEQSIKVLKKLKEKGFQIALDDFGTGYSSLSYIRMLPVEVLKIDKSFIDNLDSKDSSIALIKGMISLSHDLNMEVVAEGIEDINQLEILEHMGCDIIQGYYFSKPLPFEEVQDFYNKTHTHLS